MRKVSLNVLAISLILSCLTYAEAGSVLSVGPSSIIQFEPGQSKLTNMAKAQIEQLIQDGGQRGKIDEVQVAGWSDKPTPVGDRNLTHKDRDLAEHRIDSVMKYIRDNHNISRGATHNMAAKSTWLARTFETDDAKLKEEIVRGPNAPMSKGEFRVFKQGGGASKAVLLLIMSDDAP